MLRTRFLLLPLLSSLVVADLSGPSPLNYSNSALGAETPALARFDITPEALVAKQIEAVYPGAQLVAAREVLQTDAAPMGALLTWRVGVGEPDDGPALFSGAGYFSVLVDLRDSHPLWAMSTSGAPSGFPSDVELVWLDEGLRWAWLEGEQLVDAESGQLVPNDIFSAGLKSRVSREGTSAMLAALSEANARTSPDACSGNYGAVLGTFATQNAYSNGSCSGTGSGTYQCVEFIDRVHKVTVSHSGNANTYNDGDNPRKMNMMYFKNNNGTYNAMMGDVAVSDGGTYGHVAVFSNNCTNGSMTVMDQNWSSSSATHTVTCSGTSVGNMSSSYPIAGWLRPGWDFYSSIDTSSIYGWGLNGTRFASSDATGVTLDPASDPYIQSPSGLQLNPVPPSQGGQGYGVVKVRIKSKAPDGNLQLFFKTSNESSYDEAKSSKVTIKNDGTWQVAQFNMGGNIKWTNGGRVNQIRLDYAANGNSTSSDLVTIDAIWFQP